MSLAVATLATKEVFAAALSFKRARVSASFSGSEYSTGELDMDTLGTWVDEPRTIPGAGVSGAASLVGGFVVAGVYPEADDSCDLLASPLGLPVTDPVSAGALSSDGAGVSLPEEFRVPVISEALAPEAAIVISTMSANVLMRVLLIMEEVIRIVES